jgi:hypothetical protein
MNKNCLEELPDMTRRAYGFIWEIYRWLNKKSQNPMDVCGRKVLLTNERKRQRANFQTGSWHWWCKIWNRVRQLDTDCCQHLHYLVGYQHTEEQKYSTYLFVWTCLRSSSSYPEVPLNNCYSYHLDMI